ncbi:hypothetical protein [Bradyrhizobium canariense]|uniref:Uncharacterized protein n=1 Tax=Bradyrhizobium canariense TaxID=255045 RepID=A0A1X3H368_9BRAD|nr:hypothetical protein [Bradyrhizobium canariense]OSI68564.1 hypothetical protein BSZ22_20535 [Bradyrhizobium canariense]OSI78012.1 hypothetical protein BSZ23_19535 [Bradyrhizobium canariense]OSI89241.1 hypothetical protein BSZ25_21005 [Bradyrhizobium canariense]OSI93723.1 hypothetical protein BSZ24_12235 [Bradyrhizobium canariense]OSJ03040.1 hypothetical protein BSZ16_16430 [Bradyrhizobium canariense]
MITVVVLHAAEICNDTELRGAYVAKPRAHQVKKSECEPVIRHLLHKRRTDSGLGDVPEADLSFSQFYSWMEQNDSSFLAFTNRDVREIRC